MKLLQLATGNGQEKTEMRTQLKIVIEKKYMLGRKVRILQKTKAISKMDKLSPGR